MSINLSYEVYATTPAVQWLQCCAAELEVAGLIPVAVAIFRWVRNAKLLIYLDSGALLNNSRWSKLFQSDLLWHASYSDHGFGTQNPRI